MVSSSQLFDSASNKINSFRWLLALASTLLTCTPLLALAKQEAPPAAPYHIIELKGIEIPTLLHKPFNQLTLFAVRQGILIPIPFQLEDYDAEGYSWFKESGNTLLGTEQVFDEHDSLFFRYADAGNKLDSFNTNFSHIATEIQVSAPDSGDIHYVYVSDKVNGFTHKPLTEYDRDSGVIKSDYFSLTTNPNNFLIWNDFTYKNYHGDSKETLLDTLKIRMDAGVILESTRVTLDNRNIKTDILAVKQGPIRTVILASAYLTFAKIPVIFLDLNFQLYPQQYRIDAKVHVPAILAQLLNTPNTTFTLDGNNLNGSLLRVSSGDTVPVKVDGTMSEQELALQDLSLPRENNWIWLSTQKGFDVIAQLFVPDNFQVPISMFYVDDKDIKEEPERFKGQGPNVGYHIHDIPIDDTFHFGFSAFFADSIAPQSPESFIKSISRVPQVTTTAKIKPAQVARKAL